jgi:cadmium resistance protein CadD (predicted permease)
MATVATIAVAAGVFAGSNVDDLIVLTVLFLNARTDRTAETARPWRIVLGQYLGFAALVAISIGAAVGLVIVPDRWIGLLGLIPLTIGCRGLVLARRDGADRPAIRVRGILGVAGICVVNGADNISVYAPLLRTLSPGNGVLTVLTLFAGVAVWCAVAAWLGTRAGIIDMVGKIGHWLVPAVFVLIGFALLAAGFLR